MSNKFHYFHILLTPFVAMIVIVGGVNLGANLIKNNEKSQPALSVAYAQACPGGVLPVSNCMPAGPPSEGGKDGTFCVASGNGLTVPGICTRGCCMGSGFQSAGEASGGGGMEALSQMMQAVSQFFKPKQKQPSVPDYRPPKPVCKSLTVSPTLPLKPGESATLTWTLEGGKPDSIVVSPGVGIVTGFSVRVTPRTSTTYTVTATNERGSSTCPKVRVYVGPSDDTNGDTRSGSGQLSDNQDIEQIWIDGDNNTMPVQVNSAYDDLWNEQQSANDTVDEDEQYYDFLSLLGGSDDEDDNTNDETNYESYYTKDSDGDLQLNNFNIDDLPEVEPDWNNLDLQDGEIGEFDANGLELDAREENYDFYYEDGYEDADIADIDMPDLNPGGLTDEEVYGVWNRPQSPATGGLGLSGGFGGGSGASNVPAVDLDVPEERTSIFAKIGRWLKNMFCFWCK